MAPIEVPAPSAACEYGLTQAEGGICAAEGISAAAVPAGFHDDPERLGLALVAADSVCSAAGTFAQNRFCAAPVQVCRKHVADGSARAIILNSGNANAATGEQGLAVASGECELVAQALGCAPEEVLVGKVNQRLVWALNEYGRNAVGISGADGGTLQARAVSAELGRVGHVSEVSLGLVEAVLDEGFIPVIASVGTGKDGFYNADEAASAVAEALGADKLVCLTDVDGLYEETEGGRSTLSHLSKAETRGLLAAGGVARGMLPKVRSICEAMGRGVREVVILNGTVPHSLLIEMFTDAGIGTLFTQG